MNKKYFCNKKKSGIYLKPSSKSEKLKEILYGEEFLVNKSSKGYFFGYCKNDKYFGYILKKNISICESKHDYIVIDDKAKLYKSNNIRKPTKNYLYLNSRVGILKQDKKFSYIGQYWIKNKNIKKISKSKNINFLKNIKFYKNTKYNWGGNTSDGIDCSGLVQELMKNINKRCPRDSKDQQKFFKNKININKIRKGDLLFWKGHVAIALSKKKIVHAYGPKKKVIVMEMSGVISELLKKSLKLQSVNRPQ